MPTPQEIESINRVMSSLPPEESIPTRLQRGRVEELASRFEAERDPYVFHLLVEASTDYALEQLEDEIFGIEARNRVHEDIRVNGYRRLVPSFHLTNEPLRPANR